MAENNSNDFKGYYCKGCHTYTRLYRKEPHGHYTGRCPSCGREIFLPAGEADDSLFYTGGGTFRTINLWDSYAQGKIIGQVEAGTRAKVLEKVQYRGVTWYRVRAGKTEGWVSGTFIRRLD
jgi:hypothetical protein